MEVTILGSAEAGLLNDVISAKSSLARALLDHKVGDEFEYETPGGPRKVKILRIE